MEEDKEKKIPETAGTPESTGTDSSESSEKNAENDFSKKKEQFIREKVVKKKTPLKDRIRHVLSVIITALLFGVIASLVFVALQPIWEKYVPAVQEAVSGLTGKTTHEITVPADVDPESTRKETAETSEEETVTEAPLPTDTERIVVPTDDPAAAEEMTGDGTHEEEETGELTDEQASEGMSAEENETASEDEPAEENGTASENETAEENETSLSGETPAEGQETEEAASGEDIPESGESQVPDETTSSAPETANVSPEENETVKEDTLSAEESLDEKIQAALEADTVSEEDVIDALNAMTLQIVDFNHSIVSVTGSDVKGDGSVDWQPTAGIIWNATEREYYILFDYSSVRGSSEFTLTFYNGKTVEASLKGADDVTGIAVACCSRQEAEKAGITEDYIMELGSSYFMRTGSLVYCVGAPMGVPFSATYGMITYISTSNPGIDTDLRLLYSDISVKNNGSGFLISVEGQLMGVITSNTWNLTEGGNTAAIAISDLKSLLERLANGERAAYFGIQGMNVTEERAEQNDMPVGVYVSDALIGAPAYNSGIQSGDVITEMNGKSISTMKDVQSVLSSCDPGEEIVVKVSRQGRTQYVSLQFTVTLGSR